MKALHGISYGPLPDQHLSLYIPETPNGDLLIYFHGGGLEGWNGSDPQSQMPFYPFMEPLMDRGMTIASVEYRRYPLAHFPDYLIDAARAVKYLSENMKDYMTLKHILINGSSAGAYITMMLCVNPAYLRNFGIDPLSIDAFISDASQMTTHFNILRERGLDTRLERIDEAAPLYYVGENLKFNRLALLAYENDILCRPEQNLLFYTSLKRFAPNAKLSYRVLPGGHCAGITTPNSQGSYDVADTILTLLEDIHQEPSKQ